MGIYYKNSLYESQFSVLLQKNNHFKEELEAVINSDEQPL
jgi:hypothetical protein